MSRWIHDEKSIYLRVSMIFFSENWVKCDDDKISHISAEEVLKLSGGGKPNSNFNLNHKPITPILTPKLYLFFIIVIWKIAKPLIFFIYSGDWHCAYVLLYGPRRLEILKETS